MQKRRTFLASIGALLVPLTFSRLAGEPEPLAHAPSAGPKPTHRVDNDFRRYRTLAASAQSRGATSHQHVSE